MYQSREEKKMLEEMESEKWSLKEKWKVNKKVLERRKKKDC
jgi:hypothetical protein